MIQISNFALLISLLVAQEPSRRVPMLQVEAVQTAAKALAAGTEVRFYYVGGLTGRNRFEDIVAGIEETANAVQVEDALLRLDRLAHIRSGVRSTTESILATIREMIDPPMEEGIQRVDALERGSLVLVGTRSQHEWLAQFLAAANRFDGLIDVQARIFILDEGQLAELSQVRSGEVLDPAQASALVIELQRLGVEAVTAPRVSMSPFQEASLSIREQVAYIRDYELKVLPDQNTEIADPIVDVVNSGVQMQLRGVPLANRKLAIFVSLEYSVLERPIKTVETTLGAMGHVVTIQLPQVTRVQLEGRFEVMPGETLLLATVDPAGEHEVLVLLRATRIDIPAGKLGDDR